MIEQFHFLRPLWLLAFVLPALFVWTTTRGNDIRTRWKDMIAPHLLESLVVDASSRSGRKPAWLLAAVLALAVVGAAGPTWRKQAPPFLNDTSALVIAVDLSPTMDAIDISPSRLERAKLKIRDILDGRPGARTAVIAYAGTAHDVLPLTDDGDLLSSYTDALATCVMPVSGKDTAAALAKARAALSSTDGAGTILLLTDGIEETAYPAFKAADGRGVVVLGFGTEEGGPVKTGDGSYLTDAGGGRVTAHLDIEALKRLANETDIDVATITDDDADVRWVLGKVETDFAPARDNTGQRWQDMGWWLGIPLALLFAANFRRGWVVRVALLAICLCGLNPERSQAGTLADMWLTPDQQGRLAYERGNFAAAGSRFADPMWKGTALYRAGQYAQALDAFAVVDTAQSWYAQGNALMFLGRPREAADAYVAALAKRPDWTEATFNLAVARDLISLEKDREEESQEEGGEPPDGVRFDKKGKGGKPTVVDIAAQTSELWMKNIVVSPTDLMARRFAIEAGESR